MIKNSDKRVHGSLQKPKLILSDSALSFKSDADKNKQVKLTSLKQDIKIVANEKSKASKNDKIKPKKPCPNIVYSGSLSSNLSDNEVIRNLKSSKDKGWCKKNCILCAETFATIYCQDCTGTYCDMCYFNFHMKGVLRKHKSKKLLNKKRKEKVVEKTCVQNLELKETCIGDGTFLNGTFDEALSDRYFQEALMAWRRGKDAPYEPLFQTLSEMKSTITEIAEDDPMTLANRVKFTPSLSYADQLLLRRHRSCQLVPIEMKQILNILTLTNDDELLEHQQLLQANLMLEMSAINNAHDNDECNVNIGSLAEQWSDAIFVSGRDLRSGDQLLTNSHFQIEEVISSLNDCSKKFPIKRNENTVDAVKPRDIDNVHYEEQKDLLNSIPITHINEFPQLKLSLIKSLSGMNMDVVNEIIQSTKIWPITIEKCKEASIIDGLVPKSTHSGSNLSEDTLANVNSNTGFYDVFED